MSHRYRRSRTYEPETHLNVALGSKNDERYEGVSKSIRTGCLERELQMVRLSATRCSCLAILWVCLVSFAAIILCVASQPVTPKVSIYFVIDSVWKLLDTLSYTLTTINTRWEVTQRVMAAKLTKLTHKIAIQLHLVAESSIICSSCSRRPVRKLLDTLSYIKTNKHQLCNVELMKSAPYHNFYEVLAFWQ
jgi:hypothetical protein